MLYFHLSLLTWSCLLIRGAKSRGYEVFYSERYIILSFIIFYCFMDLFLIVGNAWKISWLFKVWTVFGILHLGIATTTLLAYFFVSPVILTCFMIFFWGTLFTIILVDEFTSKMHEMPEIPHEIAMQAIRVNLG